MTFKELPPDMEVYAQNYREYAAKTPRYINTENRGMWDAKREITALSRTIADLTEKLTYEYGVNCSWTDPTGQDETYEEGHWTTWSAEAARRTVAPVLTALRGIGDVLESVDAVAMDLSAIERLTLSTPDSALDSLRTHVRNDRARVLEKAGFGYAMSEYLAYGGLPLERGKRVLMVKPETPWDYAGGALTSALNLYSSVSVDRHEKAAVVIMKHRSEYRPECRHFFGRGEARFPPF